jgi:hypothetical protein
VAGLTVAVVKDGQLFFAKGYGWRMWTARSRSRRTRRCSGPVGVQALHLDAVMQLVEQGKLDLDADVNTYLTQFKFPPPTRRPSRSATRSPTRSGSKTAASGT